MDTRLIRNLVWVGALIASLSTGAVQADERWTFWRGPDLNGSVAAPGTFPEGNLALELLWSRPLGSSYSGIALQDGRAYTMYSDEIEDRIVALDADSGKEIWRYRIGEITRGFDGSDDGPLSTPVVSGERVFALTADGRLIALDAETGRELWQQKSLTKIVQAERPYFGFASTPLPVGDVVIVQAGGTKGRALVAFDSAEGKKRWTAAEGKTVYQSPVTIRIDGGSQVVAMLNERTVGLDPAGGAPLWTLEFPANRSGSPIPVGSNRLLLPGKKGLSLIEIRSEENGFVATEIWKLDSFDTGLSMPVVVGDHLYTFKGKFLTCLSMADGSLAWRSRPPGGHGLIAVDGHLVVFGSSGELVVVQADPKQYNERARIKISEFDGYTWPSFADGRFFVRNLQVIAAVQVTKPSALPQEREASPPSSTPTAR